MRLVRPADPAAPAAPLPAHGAAEQRRVDEAAWVLAVAKGDAAAARHLYAAHATWVRALLFRLGVPLADLDDLLQETFLSAWRALAQLRDPHAFGGFLRAIAIGHVRHLRRSKARRFWLLFLGDSTPEAAVPARDDVELASGPLAQAMRAVHALPVEERIAFVLRHVEEMTLPDAAAAAGVSLATLKRRLARAEARLKDAVAPAAEPA